MGQELLQWQIKNTSSIIYHYNPDNLNLTSHGLIQDSDFVNNTTDINDNISIVLLIIPYCIVVLIGVIGNSILVFTTLCSQTTPRLKNPFLIAVCFADLLVTGLSAPLTVLILISTKHMWLSKWLLTWLSCKSIYFMQSMPVAASTISLFMLSLDRYATVKTPRLSQLRQKRFLPMVFALCAWLSAIIFSIPLLLLAYQIAPSSASSSSIIPEAITILTTTTSTTTITTTVSITINNDTNLKHSAPLSIVPVSSVSLPSCTPVYETVQLHIAFVSVIVSYAVLVFIIPGIGIFVSHLGVRQKLCTLSLTARAAHGELPLPMPILRRPTHMIIVTGMPNAGGVNNNNNINSSDEENNVDGEKHCMMESTKLRMNPRTPRSIRRGQDIQMKAKKTSNRDDRVPSSELPLPQTSSLRSRRRLANMLIVAALIFICLWSPHVICFLCLELGGTDMCPRIVSDYCLLLGYTHSAVSPILYWILNYNSLRQTSCAPILRLTTVQKFLRTHLRVPAPPPPPSSTNEAALGPFNPRYIRARPQQYRPPASSHYLY